jgi:hypothetical protein
MRNILPRMKSFLENKYVPPDHKRDAARFLDFLDRTFRSIGCLAG